MTTRHQALGLLLGLAAAAACWPALAQDLKPVEVEGQPLAANARRLLQALDFLGAPLGAKTAAALKTAAKERDARKVQELLDPHVTVLVTINPESRVKVARTSDPDFAAGRLRAHLDQGG